MNLRHQCIELEDLPFTSRGGKVGGGKGVDYKRPKRAGEWQRVRRKEAENTLW